MLQTLTSPPKPGRGGGWKRFGAGVVGAAVVFLVLPDGSWPQALTFCVMGLLAARVAWRNARGSRDATAWRWMALGVGGNALGTLVEAFLAHVVHSDAFPSVADVFYLSLYPGIGIGLALLVRRRPGAALEASLLDSGIITAGAGLLSWVALIHPLADSADLGLFGRCVSVAYPLADLLLLAMATRLLLTTSLRTVAYRYVSAAVTCFLAVDTTWGVINHNGWAVGPWSSKALQLAVLAAYGLVAGGAAHHSARDDQLEEAERAAGLRPHMLIALTVAALTAPAVLAVQAMTGRVTDGASVAIGSALLFLLVIARMAGLLAQVERQAALLRELALVDELTGVANRRALMADLARSCEQAQRAGQPLSVAVLDLDHFKQYNDLFGHVEGDRLLTLTAQAWQQRLRGADVLGRFGGEEFVVVMPGTEVGTAEHVLRELRAATPADLTFSGGLTRWLPGETPEAVIRRADDALYVAKSRGRDQVVVAPAEFAAHERRGRPDSSTAGP
jgi:diguanylate cyclase (GGDEF)-like protein